MAISFKRILIALRPLIALAVAAAMWLPSLHLFFRPDLADFHLPNAVAPQAPALAAHHLALWEDPARRALEMKRMRPAMPSGISWAALTSCLPWRTWP